MYYSSGWWAPELPRAYKGGGPWPAQAYPLLTRSLCRKPLVYLANVGPGNVTTGSHRWKVCFGDAGGDTLCGEKSVALTTNTTTNGQAVLIFGAFPYGATTASVYRTEAGGSTFKLVASGLAKATYERKVFIDNVADGALGSAEPVSNTTSTPVSDPPTGQGLLAAMSAGTEMDLLVAYFVVGWRWVLQNGADDNALVLAPGYFHYSTTAAGEDDIDYPDAWYPYDKTPDAASIPPYSTYREGWAYKYQILEAMAVLGFNVRIDYGYTVPGDLTVTCAPIGQAVRRLTTTNEATLPENLCRVSLMAVMDLD